MRLPGGCLPTPLPLLPPVQARKWLGTERLKVMVLSPGPEAKQQASRRRSRQR